MDSREHEIGPVLEVKVMHHLYQQGIEIKVDSTKKMMDLNPGLRFVEG